MRGRTQGQCVSVRRDEEVYGVRLMAEEHEGVEGKLLKGADWVKVMVLLQVQ